MNGRSGRCCCIFSCLAASAGLAILFLGIFLALLGLLQSAEHQALRVSGGILAGAGATLLIFAGCSFFCRPSGRGEINDCCLQVTRASQVGAASREDCDSVSSGDSYYEPPPQLRVIPPTPFTLENQQGGQRPGTAPEFVVSR